MMPVPGSAADRFHLRPSGMAGAARGGKSAQRGRPVRRRPRLAPDFAPGRAPRGAATLAGAGILLALVLVFPPAAVASAPVPSPAVPSADDGAPPPEASPPAEASPTAVVLTGRVLSDPSGDPVAGARVWRADRPEAAVFTGADGLFLLPLAPSTGSDREAGGAGPVDGALHLHATAAGHGPATARIPAHAIAALVSYPRESLRGAQILQEPTSAEGRPQAGVSKCGSFHYDAFNRLVRVADPGGTVATYRYDAFNRRVEAVVGTTTRTTTWAGWQALETWTDGVLGERRTFGLGLDEVVLSERDTDGDGAPDQRYRPLFDSIGNVALVLDEAGDVIERYDYSPFGQRWVRVNDRAPPVVEQTRIEAGVLVLELSEETSRAALEAADTTGLLVLEETATATPVPFTWSLPVPEGRTARRRLVLTPDAAPTAGTELRISLGAGALTDLFGNANPAAHEQSFPWQEGIVTDTAAPELLVVALSQSRLQVTFSEPVDPATAAAALWVDGATTTWTVSADAYTLETTSALAAGSHTLRIQTTLTDLAAQPLATLFETPFEVTAEIPDRLLHLPPDPHLLTTSTLGNLYGFHGRPVDPETGLMYFRNRYYDPEVGRFVSTDPLGYVDGPNLYQYGLNSPTNYPDPLGLCPTCIQDFQEDEASAHLASLSQEERQEYMAAEWQSSRNKSSYVVGFLPVAGEAHDISQLITGRDYVSGEVLSTGERAFAGVAIFVPVVGGKVIREVGMAVVVRLDRWLGFDEIFEKGMRGFQEGAQEHLDEIGSNYLQHIPRGTTGLLPQLSQSTVDDVLASSARLKGRTPEGARAIAKKLGRAQREGFTSAFEGIQPTQTNAEAIIRQTLSNPDSVFVGDKVIDVFNAAGQGVRFDRATNTFVGFLEQGLVRP